MTRIATRVRPVALRPILSDGLPFSGSKFVLHYIVPPYALQRKTSARKVFPCFKKLGYQFFITLLVMGCGSLA
jgi:hypothetical protein